MELKAKRNSTCILCWSLFLLSGNLIQLVCSTLYFQDESITYPPSAYTHRMHRKEHKLLFWETLMHISQPKKFKLGQQGVLNFQVTVWIRFRFSTLCNKHISISEIFNYFLCSCVCVCWCVCRHPLWSPCCICAVILSSLLAGKLSTPWLFGSVGFSSM